jgi:uncharacterized protein YcbK (DUF882 family)
MVVKGGPGCANLALTDPDKTALTKRTRLGSRGQFCRRLSPKAGSHVPSRLSRQASSFLSPLRAAQCFGLAALALLGANSTLQNAIANGDTRTLTFKHSHHEGEEANLTVTFKRDGQYDEAALEKLNHFLRDWRNDKQTKMDPRLFDILWEVYREVGATEAIHIISSYRSPETNAMLRARSSGVARFSLHMLGKAMDFYIPGVPLEELRYAGLRLQRGGVGFYPSSGSPFVHMDTGGVRHWPRMAPDQLARVMSTKATTRLASVERRRMPAASSDDEEAETPRPVASRMPVRSKPATVATVPNAQAAFALASASSTPFQLGEAPRPPAPVRGPAPAETTASVQSWLNDIDSRPVNDRVAPETALAYAAAAAPEQPQRTASLVNPMGTPRMAPPMPAASQVVPKTPGKAVVPPKVGQTYNDPWMRSITLAASVHYSHVTMYGPFDARGVQTLMQKPAASLALTFREDPYDGMTSYRFDGPAVSFLPTLPFRQRQASLR